MHIRIIVGDKLDCIGSNYPEAADSARNLKLKAFAADDVYQASLLDATIQNAHEIHHILEDIQTRATDICDNGTNRTAMQICAELDDYAEQLDLLI